jgi:hypothetical protein
MSSEGEREEGQTCVKWIESTNVIQVPSQLQSDWRDVLATPDILDRIRKTDHPYHCWIDMPAENSILHPAAY